MGTDGDMVEAPGAPPPALLQSATPLTLLQALRRCWLKALPLGLLLFCVAGGLDWALRPDKYTADALLHVASAEQKILQDTGRSEWDWGNQYRRTQVALIKSRPVLKAALKEEKVRQLPLVREQQNPVEWLQKELKVELVDQTEVLRLSLSSRTHHEDLAPIINAVQEAYMTEIVKGAQSQQLALLNDMEMIYTSSQEKLRAQRESLRRLAETLKTGDSQILSVRQKNLLDEYASLRKELAGLQARLREAQVKLATSRLKAAAAAPPAAGAGAAALPDALDGVIEREVDADPFVQKQSEALAKKEDVVAQLDRVVADPNEPVRQQYQREVEAARRVLEQTRAARRAVVAARVRKGLEGEGVLRSREVEEEIKILEKQREALQAEAAGVGREVDRVGISSVDLELKRSEIEQAELVLKALRTEKERLQIELQATVKRRVSVLALADEATVASKLARPAEALAVAFAGMFVGLFAVSYREFRARKLYTPAQVTEGLRLRVMGALPALPRPAEAPAAGSSGGVHDRMLVESVDSLRTMLLQGRLAGGSCLLLISSACTGEGKTMLAGQLAVSLARAGRRTLLVDCDLRKPCLHRLFSLPRTPGLCDLLCSLAREEDVVQPTEVPGLYLLPAGRFSPQAAAALAQGAVEAIFQRLRGRFDSVVVDSSPVLAVPDTLMIARSADGVVFSIRPGVSQGPLVYAAYERLRDLGLPFIGTVVNGVSSKLLYASNYYYVASAD
jgi:capsular exopolysaccharide synthesis family protein